MRTNSNHQLNECITVVIRSVRERTERACVAAITSQGIRPNNITIINETPFAKALKSSYQVGLESDRSWTLCVDADVLLRPNSISALLDLALRQSESTCVVQGLMLDKFTVAFRAGGIHLYRSSLLKDAILEIPAEGLDIRPETFVLHAMARHGHLWITVPYVIGIHDFGQYFEDIFRKCYVHAHKHLMHLPVLLPNWRKRAEFDPDFEVAIEGLVCGLRERGAIHIDKRLTSVSEAFAQLDFAEKVAAVPEEFMPIEVENLLKEWATNDVPVHGFPVTAREVIKFGPDTRFTLICRVLGSLRKSSGKIGILRTVPFALGSGIERLGLLIKRIATGRRERS